MNKQDELRHIYSQSTGAIDSRSGARQQIEEDTRRFLEGGGTITQVPASMSGEEWEKWEWDKVARYSYRQAQDKKMGAEAP